MRRRQTISSAQGSRPVRSVDSLPVEATSRCFCGAKTVKSLGLTAETRREKGENSASSPSGKLSVPQTLRLDTQTKREGKEVPHLQDNEQQ